jgi:LPXTG-motif cell wall-anchored protein
MLEVLPPLPVADTSPVLPAGTLPLTGAPVAPLVALGMLLAASGAGLAVTTRRRAR